jgi:2-polyprenyl-6-methoxyphenol hydroxylase-like FAD-dependent oxidoreductase
MAIEDALVLARSLRTANSISSAFTAYEHERRDRVERVVTQGERNGNQKEPGQMARLPRDYVILPVGLRFAERLANSQWMFDHHIEWVPRERPGTGRRPRATRERVRPSSGLKGIHLASPIPRP